MLNKAFQAARSARKIAVVEVLGEQAGWIALQAGIAAPCRCGDNARDPMRYKECGGKAEG